MNLYGRAEEAATAIIDAFKGGKVPAALATVLLGAGHRKAGPSAKWSWGNQLLMALHGHDDARGFRQWKEVGRYVRPGEHGFPIFVPITRKVRQEDEEGKQDERLALVGFSTTTVFGYEQTAGEPLADRESEQQFIQGLPLVDVAKAWGLAVHTYAGQKGRPLGWCNGQEIALGVENVSTWAHELCHEADRRAGGMDQEDNTRPMAEVVAELGGATLLRLLGRGEESDVGGAWVYIAGWSEAGKRTPIAACLVVLGRVATAVALILETADQAAVSAVAA